MMNFLVGAIVSAIFWLIDADFYRNSKKQGMKRPIMVGVDKKSAEFAK